MLYKFMDKLNVSIYQNRKLFTRSSIHFTTNNLCKGHYNDITVLMPASDNEKSFWRCEILPLITSAVNHVH